jgi:hypothetical protein
MTDDLVKRLSGIADVLTVLFPEFSKDINAAAARIEQLQAALKRAAHELDMEGVENNYAIAALGEKKDD